MDTKIFQELFPQIPLWLIIVIVVWSLTWKAFALWKSARKNHKVWFVILLLTNTLGILEALYIFLFSEIKLDEVKTDNRKFKSSTRSKRGSK